MDTYITKGSFKFGSVDMYQRFGVRISDSSVPQDVFLPSLRSRKVEIPLRHGQYDYGAKYYRERPLQLNCVVPGWLKEDEATIRGFGREIAYILSEKDEIRIWNEPDKYYIGRVYDEIALTQVRNTGLVFTLTFTCDPFLYGETKTEQMESLMYLPEYKGTANTPTYIEITNTGTTAAVNIQIVKTDKRGTF